MAKKLVTWILVALVFQLGIYLYMDRVMLAPAATFSQQAVESNTKAKTGSNIFYSFDNSYYGELTDSGFKVYATEKNEVVKEIKLESNEKATYFSWLPDRNLALLGISQSTAKGTTVSLHPINPVTNSKPVIPKVDGLRKGAHIISVAYSTETNVINMLIKSGSSMFVYRTDANNYLRRVSLNTSKINRIANLKGQDGLLYDSEDNGKVYMVDGFGTRKELSPKNHQFALIGVDKEDNIYIGQLNDRKQVTAIMVGKVNSQFTEYKKLDSPCPLGTVKVTYEGKILFS